MERARPATTHEDAAAPTAGSEPSADVDAALLTAGLSSRRASAAGAPPTPPSPNAVLALQRLVGNQAVTAAVQRRARTGPDTGHRAGSGRPSLRVLDRIRIQRATVTSWAGEWKTRRYKTQKNAAGTPNGVDIEIEFIPNDKVNAKKIGIVQGAMSQSAGTAPFFDPKVNPERKARSITKGRMLGFGIDQLPGFVNPLYPTEAGSAGDTLTSTPLVPHTSAGGGRHGSRWVDGAGKEHKRSALMNDAPALPVANDSRQEFETTALAIQGEQFGTYYGSVHWGWRRDAAGKFRRLPFTLKRNDAPSGAFNTVAGLWNRTSSAAGVAHVRLPTAVGRWVSAPDSALVEDPAVAPPKELAKLAVADRVEVTDKGARRPFNRGPDKWWKVTAVSGTFIGLVGWTLSGNLTSKKPAAP